MSSSQVLDSIILGIARKSGMKNSDPQSLMDVKQMLSTMLSLIGKIPSPNDFMYFKSFPEFSTVTSDIKSRSLSSIQTITNCYFPSFYEDLNEIDDSCESVDFCFFNCLISAILSIVDKLMRDITSKNINLSICQANTPVPFYKQVDNTHFEFLHYLVSVDLPKPQIYFESKISTDSNSFVPTLRMKHNAKSEFKYDGYGMMPSMFLLQDYSRQIGVDIQNNELHGYLNPYAYEINHIVYPEFVDKCPESIVEPAPLNSSPYEFIDSIGELERIIQILVKETCIAFDIRNHSYRSYFGFTCILIISTRLVDYIIDAVKLHDSMWKMNEVFSLESVMKIHTGNDRNILLLQKDFSIYIVNLFSLRQAARVLSFDTVDLRSLLSLFCNLQYSSLSTRCDWRVRPLTTVMIEDCRQETHFMIYICDVLRKKLIECSPPHMNLIHDVMARGNEVSLQSYEKPLCSYERGSWTIPKMGLVFTSQQKTLFLALMYWRDISARILDESCEYILPINCLLTIVYSTTSDEDIDAAMKRASPAVKQLGSFVKELVRRTLEVRADKMAVYAVIVEEVCRKEFNCDIKTCQYTLSDSYTVSDVSFGKKSEETVLENEMMPCSSSDATLQRLINHGTFKYVHSGIQHDDGYLYYNPDSLPYNPTTPMRNTVPYIPIEVDDNGIRISNVIPREYINSHMRDYIDNVNRNRTQKDIDEMHFIKESLNLSTINDNLMMLGSVLKDDTISISSDDDSKMDNDLCSSADTTTDEFVPHYPPRTLREIYSLPHRNRGDLKDGLSVSGEEMEGIFGVVKTSELDNEELNSLLVEGETKDMTDMEFLESIGWKSKLSGVEHLSTNSSDSGRSATISMNRSNPVTPTDKRSHKNAISEKRNETDSTQGDYYQNNENNGKGRKYSGKPQRGYSMRG